MNEKNKSKENVFSYIKKDKSIMVIVILVAIGLLLLIVPEKSSQSVSKSDFDRVYEYELQVETKIKELCSKINGISEVNVSVYLDSGFETVYAYNEENKATSNGVNSEKKYVTIGSGDNEAMVCLYERMPNICGIAIVCKGGSNPIAANEIINLISSAFGVPKNKIYITEGKN